MTNGHLEPTWGQTEPPAPGRVYNSNLFRKGEREAHALAAGALQVEVEMLSSRRTLFVALAVLLAAGRPAAAQLKAAPGDWPAWRGPDRTGLSPETGLLKEWPQGGPKLLWTAKGLGDGYSTPALAGGRIYLMG